MFFAIFGFFLKIYQNMGQKLGSNSTLQEQVSLASYRRPLGTSNQ
jgi:hypothetical protein